ncbi:MAG: HDOD domain-containing protein [Aminivibrio sp.]|nr:HDOD domain-containing protein [Aminivibrio sp.]
MGLMNVDQLMPGMVLEKNLLAFNGRFLLPRGAVLTEGHIRTMKTWGVVEAEIEGEDATGTAEIIVPEIPGEILRQAERSVSALFAAPPLRSPMKEIYALALERTAVSLKEGRKDAAGIIENGSLSREKVNRAAGKARGNITPADLVSRELRLASLPDVYYQIMEVINSARSSAAHIAEAVSRDTSLLARLLKLVNSAFYGFPSKIETVSRAVAVIGTKELSTLALGITAVQYFNDIPPEFVDMQNFWRHSVACGVYARLLASEKVGVSEERLFVAGLLHDLGKLVLFRQIPVSAREAMELSAEKRIPVCDAEREVLGFDHAQVGALLLREWKIPAPLETAVRFHHSSPGFPSALEPSLLNVADTLAIAMGMGKSGSSTVPGIRPETWEATGLSAGVFHPVVRQGDRQIDDITAAFLGNGGR